MGPVGAFVRCLFLIFLLIEVVCCLIIYFSATFLIINFEFSYATRIQTAVALIVAIITLSVAYEGYAAARAKCSYRLYWFCAIFAVLLLLQVIIQMRFWRENKIKYQVNERNEETRKNSLLRNNLLTISSIMENNLQEKNANFAFGNDFNYFSKYNMGNMYEEKRVNVDKSKLHQEVHYVKQSTENTKFQKTNTLNYSPLALILYRFTYISKIVVIISGLACAYLCQFCHV